MEAAGRGVTAREARAAAAGREARILAETTSPSRSAAFRLAAEKLGLSLLFALIYILSINNMSLGWLGFVALVPLILLHLHPRYDGRWYWMLPGVLVLEFWKYRLMGSAYGAIAPVALTVVLTPPLLAFPLILRFVRRRARLPLVLLVPLAWCTVEWIRIHLSVGNMAHVGLGTTLFVYLHLIQIADILGYYGVCALTALVNGAVAEVLLGVGRLPGRLAGILNRRVVTAVAIALAALLLANLYGVARLASLKTEEGPRIAILQPNLPHETERAYWIHQQQYRLSKERIEPGSADLLAWPENAIMDYVREEGTYYLGELGELAAELGMPLYVGGFGLDEEARETTNSVWYILPNGEVAGVYDKQVLAPWTEYIPLNSLFSWSAPLREAYASLVRKVLGHVPPGLRGDGPRTFTLETPEGTWEFGTIICGENVIPWVAREMVAAGARFLINPTSEGYLGKHVYYTTWANCVLRAVENRVGVARVGNNGISGFIGPDGQGYGEVRDDRGRLWMTVGTSTERVYVTPSGPTLFTRFGAWIASFFPLATCLLMAGLEIRRRFGPRAPAPPA